MSSSYTQTRVLVGATSVAAVVGGALLWRHYRRKSRKSRNATHLKPVTATAASSKLVSSHDLLPSTREQLQAALAEEENFMSADVVDEFDADIEEQQCDNLMDLLQRLSGVGESGVAAVADLPVLLGAYRQRVQDAAWCAQRSHVLESASNTIYELLTADSERELAEEIECGRTISELTKTIAALKLALESKASGISSCAPAGSGCCGGGSCGNGNNLTPAAPTSAGCCGGGSCGSGKTLPPVAPVSSGGCCGGGGCGSGVAVNNNDNARTNCCGGGTCGSEGPVAAADISTSPVQESSSGVLRLAPEL